MQFILADDNETDNDNDINEDNQENCNHQEIYKNNNISKYKSSDNNTKFSELSYENLNSDLIIKSISNEYKPFIEMYFQKFKDETPNLYRLPNLFVLYIKIHLKYSSILYIFLKILIIFYVILISKRK